MPKKPANETSAARTKRLGRLLADNTKPEKINVPKALKTLGKLQECELDAEQLQTSKVITLMNRLRSCPSEAIAQHAGELFAKWELLAKSFSVTLHGQTPSP